MPWFISERPARPDWSGPARSPNPAEIVWSRWDDDDTGAPYIDAKAERMLLLRTAGGRVLLFDAARVRELPRGSTHDDDFEALRERASAAAAAWWRERDREARTRSRLRGLVDYGDVLQETDSREAVLEALVAHAGRIVGAAGGAVVERVLRPGAQGAHRAPEARIVFPEGLRLEHATSDWVELLERPGVRRTEELTTPADPSGDAPEAPGTAHGSSGEAGGTPGPTVPDSSYGGPDSGGIMARVAHTLRARLLVHYPLFDDLVLLLAERRDTRVFDDEDWEVLHGMAQMTQGALTRLAAGN